ncbi:CHAT domain-containing protein [Paenarthrobacter sp. RAF54_2]|uniref:CHAT domain-containing protein n=1 Tax=Paenarthrobacter sp. RAF54_2 TaxID=3233061 RepID=UPI003F97B413
MSSVQYRAQLERKRKQRADVEKRLGEYRKKETVKRSGAARARAAADKSTVPSHIANKRREAERLENEAAIAGKEAGRLQDRAAAIAHEELRLQSRLNSAERSEADAAERKRKREQQKEDRSRIAENGVMRRRIDQAETVAKQAMRNLPTPKSERLRILLLGSSSEGDLRIGREQKRIRAAVESALHRDLVELDVRPSATTDDLLDGITKFRPHIVHFSGHSDDDLIMFEREQDEHHEGLEVSAKAFISAVKATDQPPLLVLLNSCNSARQIDRIVEEVAPFAIGMADEIDDGDAITYAAQFYAAIANGQSVRSSHLSAQAALELGGLEGADLPTLASASDVDPATTVLVKPAVAS